MASGAVGVVAVSNAMTTEAPPGATEEASRTEGEAAVEEAATEEVSRLAQFSLLVPWSAVGFDCSFSQQGSRERFPSSSPGLSSGRELR